MSPEVHFVHCPTCCFLIGVVIEGEGEDGSPNPKTSKHLSELLFICTWTERKCISLDLVATKRLETSTSSTPWKLKGDLFSRCHSNFTHSCYNMT